MEDAKRLGISGFVVDWYGDREPFLDRSYALIQSIAAETDFHVAMMYDETQQDEGQSTDDALAAFRYGVTAEVARAEGLALSIAGGDGQ